MDFDAALAYIKKLNGRSFAGFKDWRLPTLEEAMSLMEPKQKNRNLYIDPIFDKKQQWIWTSDKESASSAWVVYFYDGTCHLYHVYYGTFVRAVR